MEIIVTHKNADFDSVAAVFAGTLLYPGARAVLPTSLNPNVRNFLSIHQDHFAYFNPKELNSEEATRLIVVDASSWGRLEGTDRLAEKRDLEIHIWDHHSEPGDIKAEWVCREAVGSTTTLLSGRLEEEMRELTSIQATLFLAGIYEDTGNLTFPATTGKDARAAAFLLEQRADLSIVKNFLRPAYGPKQKDILFEMLKDARRIKVNGYTVSLNRVDIEGHTPGLALVVDMFQDIVNVDAAFGIFTETKKDRCMVIGRSSDNTLNIGSVMRAMGGGGHPNAGSVLLKSVDPAAIEAWIAELIKTDHQATVQIGDLMSFPVFTVPHDITMREVAHLLREKGCTGIPVMDGEKVVGIISRKDFRKLRKSSQMDAPVKAFMSTEVIQISPGTGVLEAVRLMVKRNVGRLPVLQNGKLIGIVTRSDAMRYYYDLLPD